MSNAPAADPQVSRRFALKAIGATLGLGAFAVSLAPVAEWAAEQNVEDFLQKHYKELTPEQKAAIVHIQDSLSLPRCKRQSTTLRVMPDAQTKRGRHDGRPHFLFSGDERFSGYRLWKLYSLLLGSKSASVSPTLNFKSW